MNDILKLYHKGAEKILRWTDKGVLYHSPCCNYQPTRPGDTFCNCGITDIIYAFRQEQLSRSPLMITCTKCGKEVNDKYCGNCGTMVKFVPAKPELISTLNFSVLIEACAGYINSEPNDPTFDEDDVEHYIFEAAMNACFGHGVWAYINNKHNGGNHV